MSGERQPRVIKRYANRKLYDMSESCYITHDEIARLVKNGDDVRIIDNRTKEDLTALTLTQILFKEEKQHRKTLPLTTLRTILQSGGDFIQRHITQPITELRDEAEETVRRAEETVRKVFGKTQSELDAEGAAAAEEEDRETAETEDAPTSDTSTPARPKGTESLREWIDSTQRAYENLQRTLEDRWTLIIESLGYFDANRQRIAELERRVAALEAERGHTGKGEDEGEGGGP